MESNRHSLLNNKSVRLFCAIAVTPEVTNVMAIMIVFSDGIISEWKGCEKYDNVHCKINELIPHYGNPQGVFIGILQICRKNIVSL